MPYLGYMPGGLPVALQAGKLDADLKVDFERAATAGLKLTGTVGAHGIKLADARRRATCSASIRSRSAWPTCGRWSGVVHLGEVALAAPQLVVARDAAGRLNLLATDRATGASEKAAPAAAPQADGGTPPSRPSTPAWRIQVDKVALTRRRDRLARPDHPAGRRHRREAARQSKPVR